jgi:hypothetical protein
LVWIRRIPHASPTRPRGGFECHNDQFAGCQECHEAMMICGMWSGSQRERESPKDLGWLARLRGRAHGCAIYRKLGYLSMVATHGPMGWVGTKRWMITQAVLWTHCSMIRILPQDPNHIGGCQS